ncbi:MAG: DUF1553 domain-containing protein [Planctomycetaceae bacterium]|nr:DUF1553 domain-containing protein [Planctomycetaceae bacterium]
MFHFLILVSALLGTLTVSCVQVSLAQQPSSPPSSARQIDFDTQIRPLLSDRCYTCHGPDEESREANLRLDLGTNLHGQLSESNGRPILDPGQAQASELYLRLLAEDHERMPPADSGLSLTADEINVIKQWIDEGAVWDRHWSFQPIPDETAVPQVTDPAGWIQNPIDAFVLELIQARGLRPASAAADHHLLRRMYLDLIGLPPTIEEVHTWAKVPKPERWAKVADHLLARPEFGQRMASDWLDVARYSDTYGYQVDRERFVWPWRDWVVQAFNENMPFDRFGTLQLAGDLQPNATFQEILPTTFSRLHPQEVEGGSIEEEFRMKYVSDRTETYGMAFLGMTFECSRCHNHKYDPISQSDYYRLTAFFDNIDEAGLYSYFTDSVPTPTAVIPDANLEKEADLLKAQIAAQEKSMSDQLSRILETQPWRPPSAGLESTPSQTAPTTGTQNEAASPSSTGPASPLPEIDGQIAFLSYDSAAKWPENSENRLVPFDVGTAPHQRQAVELSGDEAVRLDVGNFRRWQPFSFSLWIWIPKPMERAVVLHRSQAWTDAGSRGYELLIEDQRLKFSLIHFWPGNAVSVRGVAPAALETWQHVTVTYDGSSRADGIEIYVDGQKAKTEVIRDKLTKQITGGGGDNISLGERMRDQGFTKGRLAEVRVFSRQLSSLEARALSKPDFNVSSLAEYRQTAWSDSAATTNERDRSSGSSQTSELVEIAEDWALQFSPEYREALQKLEQLRSQLGNLQDRRQEIMVMQELPFKKPSYLRARGDYDAPTTEVSPGVPESIAEWSDSLPENRDGLAKWTFDRRNPLTARVAVNRWWQMLFGEGLVRTPEDFGNQGQRPTHPLLLDYLADFLIDSGWDVKQTIRLMVLSATYQQSVVADAATLEADPENLLWTRASSHRWPAETLRDQALVVAGLLDAKLDGPPVKPYDLAEAFAPLPADGGALVYRRSLYTYWKRMSPSPVMIALDAVKRDVCQVKRERTTTPAQSLVFLNAPQFVEAARALAVRCWNQHPNRIENAISALVREMLSREPSEMEFATLLKLYETQRLRFEQSPDSLQAYLQIGHHRLPAELPAPQLGALAVVANTLMGLDQWTTRR